MRYEVIGADRASGRDVSRVYIADEEEGAIRQANADGIVVVSVDILIDFNGLSPAGVAEPSLADRLAHLNPSAASAMPKRTAADAHAPAALPDVPEYPGLLLAGSVLRVYAIVCDVLGGGALLAALVGLGIGLASNTGFAGIVVRLPPFAPALALLLAGAFGHAASVACAAIRDIAQNSWR